MDYKKLTDAEYADKVKVDPMDLKADYERTLEMDIPEKTPTKILGSYTLPGRVRSKKNSRRIVFRGKGPKSLPSEAYETWQKNSLPRLRAQKPKGMQPINEPVELTTVFYTTTDDYDLTNHIQSIEDILQDAEILEDDKLVQSPDGSRKVVMCPLCPYRGEYVRGPKKGQRKPNCGAASKCPFVCCHITLKRFTAPNQIPAPLEDLVTVEDLIKGGLV